MQRSKRKRRQDVRGEDGGAVQHLGVKSEVRMWNEKCLEVGRRETEIDRTLVLIWMDLLVS